MAFLAKFRTLILGTANDLLDKQIDLNSPTMLRQYVRDLEDALSKMQDESIRQEASVRTMTRELSDSQTAIDVKKAKITALMSAQKTDAARAIGTDVLALQSSVDRKKTDLANQVQSSNALNNAVTNLDQKHTQMMSRLRELESLDRDTKIKEQSASALNAASKLVSGGADISVDDIESKMRRNNDVAQTRFDRAMGGVQVEEDPDHAQQVDDLLNSLAPAAAKKDSKQVA